MKELQTVLNNILTDKNTNLKPENLKKDVTCLGVTGTLEVSTASGGVKQFATEEEMNADENPSEGDLAVVYREDLQAWDGSSKIMALTFPKTVVLSSASTGRCYGDYYANWIITIQGNVSSTSAEFNIKTSYGNVSYIITYTSTDGLTYTRTDTYAETITIADEFITMSMSSWKAICGYFMQIPSYYFGGIYEYSTYFNKKKFATYTNFGYDTSFKKELDGYIALEDLTKLQNFVLETAFNTLNVLVVKTRENPNILTGYTYDYGGSTHYTPGLCIIDGVIHPGWKSTDSYTTTIQTKLRLVVMLLRRVLTQSVHLHLISITDQILYQQMLTLQQ